MAEGPFLPRRRPDCSTSGGAGSSASHKQRGAQAAAVPLGLCHPQDGATRTRDRNSENQGPGEKSSPSEKSLQFV